MKQTAVDWLQQALEDTILTHEQIMQTVGLFEQAKEMEQEQMIDWYATGQADTVNMYEQHLNKTFNTGSGELINEIKSYVTFNRKENI
jgi:hypothetical protein